MTESVTDFTPIYARVQRFVRDEIASGRLKEGDRVPSEPALAERFGTTRATVARALQELVYAGIIVRRSGSGTFVAPRSISAPIDLTRVHSFEEQVTALGARIDYELLGFEHRAASDSEAFKLHLDPGGKVYALDRLRIVDGQKISLECRVLPEELGRRITLEMLRTQSIHQILDEGFGLRVWRVEGRIRAGVAQSDVAAKLGVAAGSALIIRDYVLYSVDRRPLVTGESLYRDDFHIDYVVQQSEGDAAAHPSDTSP